MTVGPSPFYFFLKKIKKIKWLIVLGMMASCQKVVLRALKLRFVHHYALGNVISYIVNLFFIKTSTLFFFWIVLSPCVCVCVISLWSVMFWVPPILLLFGLVLLRPSHSNPAAGGGDDDADNNELFSSLDSSLTGDDDPSAGIIYSNQASQSPDGDGHGNLFLDDFSSSSDAAAATTEESDLDVAFSSSSLTDSSETTTLNSMPLDSFSLSGADSSDLSSSSNIAGDPSCSSSGDGSYGKRKRSGGEVCVPNGGGSVSPPLLMVPKFEDFSSLLQGKYCKKNG